MSKEVQKRSDYPKPKKVEKEIKERKMPNLNGIMGVLQLFVVASIVFSSYVVIMGTEGITPKALVAPQVFWAVVVLINKFSK